MPTALKTYGLGVVILTFYGVEVCPFLDQLENHELGVILAGCFLVAAWLRGFLLQSLFAGGPPPTWALFLVEYSAWILAGLLMTGWNLYHYAFPIVISGMKMMVGCLGLGLFGAAYAVLDDQREIPPEDVEGTGTFTSLATKLCVLSMGTVATVCGMLALLFHKDFREMRLAISRGQVPGFHEVGMEVLFVSLVLLAASALVAYAFSRNLDGILTIQLEALAAVERGDLSREVPVLSDDELGSIARGTNRMIAGLRERARIEDAFGKYVSREVAETILEREGGTDLGGREVEVAVLFSDLRNFTPLSEALTPTELVAFLNEYFTGLVAAVHAQGGVVDKFIGDAAMAVYGLDGREDACARALATAREMQAFVAELNGRLAAAGRPRVATGVGIHFGPVVAGNIGSPERLEYTVIGDAVNVAARLESATKELGVKVAVSQEVRDRLDDDAARGLRDLGAHPLKGKSADVGIHGLD